MVYVSQVDNAIDNANANRDIATAPENVFVILVGREDIARNRVTAAIMEMAAPILVVYMTTKVGLTGYR